MYMVTYSNGHTETVSGSVTLAYLHRKTTQYGRVLTMTPVELPVIQLEPIRAPRSFASWQETETYI